MAFYTNPGWSNLTPPPVSEQNLNDMSNALEKAAYIENGKLYDNDNHLVDIGNAKITLGSYVGTDVFQFTIQIPENQLFFIMLSGANGGLGDITDIDTADFSVPVSWNGIMYENGFVEQLYNTITPGIMKIGYYKATGNQYAGIQRTSNGQDGQLSFTIHSSSNRNIYNRPNETYHYATIGV